MWCSSNLSKVHSQLWKCSHPIFDWSYVPYSVLEQVGIANAVSRPGSYAWWFSIPLLAVCNQGRNLEFGHGAAMTRLLFMKDTVRILTFTHLCWQTRRQFNVHLRGQHTHWWIDHPACETPGWPFIAGLGFKPRLDSIEVSVHTLRSSCQSGHILSHC